MSDDTLDVKAQKLAAARKKLKEYQQRNNNVDEHFGTNTNSSTVSVASNLSERSDCESNSVVNSGGIQSDQVLDYTTPAPSGDTYISQNTMPMIEPEQDPKYLWPINGQSDTNVQTIQVLIAEKTQLSTELTKSRHTCRDRELELEELRTEQNQIMQRLEQLQQHYQDQQNIAGQLRNQNVELQHKLAVANAQIGDHQTHLSELEAQFQQLKASQEELQQKHTVTCNDLDMAQLRIRQLSDESNVNADNRVETLTQTQYMYEQQIRDLQQMVTQLTQDKEQAAIQYQNYVANLKERNAELTEETADLKERERQLVQHVSSLEHDIQKNLALQAQYKETANIQSQSSEVQSEPTSNEKLSELKEKIDDLEFERHEFQLKVKSQDDELQLRNTEIAKLQDQLARLQADQPNQIKLLATMESDKVAASRALSQNIDMKQQMDELQQRFVQLTNDKLELVNKLDAEEFANREMRLNYASMEEKLQANEKRFRFKDEEMIRLSRENSALQRSMLMLQQQVDRLQHYEAKAYHSPDANKVSSVETEPKELASEPQENSDQQVKQEEDHRGEDRHNHLEHNHEQSHNDQESMCETPLLPTAEAVEKLQARFTTLISQVADLTEEKHSLEHLVLQLQSETETIGEYIALYQTQRRMLKQREYEKATQMRLLEAEREQLREKIDTLTKLVGNLGAAANLPANQTQKSEDINVAAQQENLGDNASDNDAKILHKIRDIITEIKVNAEQVPTSMSTTGQSSHPVDHLNCCLGKFEVV